MQEFDAVKVSTYEAEKLAAQLTERSADGWSVVSIVSAGSDVVAYLSRAGGATAATSEPADVGTSEPQANAMPAAEPTATQPASTEPAGWGTEPAASAETSSSGWGTGEAESSGGSGEWGTADTGTAVGATTAGAATTGADQGAGDAGPAVPPGWYTDPSARFELRYWDGSSWTEHVSRGGQQYTDPPVA